METALAGADQSEVFSRPLSVLLAPPQRKEQPSCSNDVSSRRRWTGRHCFLLPGTMGRGLPTGGTPPQKADDCRSLSRMCECWSTRERYGGLSCCGAGSSTVTASVGIAAMAGRTKGRGRGKKMASRPRLALQTKCENDDIWTTATAGGSTGTKPSRTAPFQGIGILGQ
jgi:hypothetical protein